MMKLFQHLFDWLHLSCFCFSSDVSSFCIVFLFIFFTYIFCSFVLFFCINVIRRGGTRVRQSGCRNFEGLDRNPERAETAGLADK